MAALQVAAFVQFVVTAALQATSLRVAAPQVAALVTYSVRREKRSLMVLFICLVLSIATWTEASSHSDIILFTLARLEG